MLGSVCKELWHLQNTDCTDMLKSVIGKSQLSGKFVYMFSYHINDEHAFTTHLIFLMRNFLILSIIIKISNSLKENAIKHKELSHSISRLRKGFTILNVPNYIIWKKTLIDS